MRHRVLGLPSRIAAVASVSVALALGFGPPSQVVSADESSQQTVTQEEIEVPGNETATDGGVAVAGPVVANAHAVVRQRNIQVAVGDQQALDNSSQTAGNIADVNQATIAVAGDATASGGGTASSGYAMARASAVIIQMNIQVIALLSPDCVATQDALNDAQVDQTAAALSGAATAEGAGNTAASGNARASARQVIVQRNVQIYVCTGRNLGVSTGDQQAANGLSAAQDAAALSGNATATVDSNAASGEVRAFLSNVQRQVNRQIVIE